MSEESTPSPVPESRAWLKYFHNRVGLVSDATGEVGEVLVEEMPRIDSRRPKQSTLFARRRPPLQAAALLTMHLPKLLPPELAGYTDTLILEEELEDELTEWRQGRLRVAMGGGVDLLSVSWLSETESQAVRHAVFE